MLNQPIKLNSSSSSLELKSLLIALAIIFFINTPLSFVKSQKLSSVEQRIQLVNNAIHARQLAVTKALQIAQLNVIKTGRLTKSDFNELTHLFLTDQSVISTIELREVKDNAPLCHPVASTLNQDFSFTGKTEYHPQQQTMELYQTICNTGKFYAFLYVTIDLYQLMDLSNPNTSILNAQGQVISSEDPTLRPGEFFADHYPTFWRELEISDKNNSIIEYNSSAIVYRKITLFDGQSAFLLQRMTSKDLIPSYVYFVVVLIAVIIGIALYIYQLRREKAELSTIGYQDQLSGLYNRHYLSKLEKTSEIDKRYLCCLFDIDNFKQINDTYGHDIGDQIIKRVASTIKSRTRGVDYCFRIGGEEFLVLLRTDENVEVALSACQRIRTTIADLEQQPKVTVSCGVHPMEQSLHETIKKADEKLYTAKNSGKNCVIY